MYVLYTYNVIVFHKSINSLICFPFPSSDVFAIKTNDFLFFFLIYNYCFNIPCKCLCILRFKLKNKINKIKKQL